MSEIPTPSSPSTPPPSGARPDPDTAAPHAAAVRGYAFGLALAGAVCLYFGFSLVADAPGSATPAEAERWFALDHAANWALRGIGLLLLCAAGLASLGARSAMLVGLAGETLLAVLLVAMSLEWTVEARADGGWSPAVILLLILAAMSVSSALRCWRVYRGRPVP